MSPPDLSRHLLSRLAPLDTETDSGLRVRVRPVVPTDSSRIDGAYELLSEASRRNRFWAAPTRLADARKSELTDTDGEGHIAWLALDLADEDFPGFAGASFWRDPRDPSRAELAITVADAWHRQGLGTLLFSILWHDGWQLGVRSFHGVCRAANGAMLAWWRGLGGEAVVAGRHGELSFPLESPEAFAMRVAYEMPPLRRRVELAERLVHWADLVGSGQE